jgi:hypothetical protein
MRAFCFTTIIASLFWATPAAGQQTFTVSGRVLTSSGAPLQGKDLFILIGHDEGNGSTSATSRIEEDGTFRCDLPPGRYLLTAGSSLSPAGDVMPLLERGFAAVTVSRADVPAVVIRTRPRVRVRGRVRYDAERAATTYPSVNLFSVPAFDSLGGGGGEDHARFGPDGTFELVVAAVPVVIRSGYGGTGPDMWWPGPVLLDGRDITDVPTDFSKTEGELEVVFTQRPIGVFGIVTEEATGLPAENASVVVFSADPSLRQPWAEASKLISTDDNGRFWGTLSAGRYLAVAFPAGTIDSRTTAFRNLESFVKLATSFTIDPDRRGARVRLTLSRSPILRR